jgi:proline iminopeptidase
MKNSKQNSIEKGYLEVGHGHELFYEVYGNPKGIPTLFVHGGPGVGYLESDKRYFDPKIFKVIFFDQRGASRSKPFGSIEYNETNFLLQDIIVLLDYLRTDKVLVFGGSWGSTLSLLFAIKHPKRIIGMVLRGIFLANRESIDHITQGGVNKYYPQEWERVEQLVPRECKDNIAKYYLEQMKSDDPLISNKYAFEWIYYDLSIYKKEMDSKKTKKAMETYPIKSLAILEVHYLSNYCFIEENYILKNLTNIKKIPISIVQGRFDALCPPVYAYQLHKNLDNSILHFVDAGHSESEPAIEIQLKKSLNNMIQQLKSIKMEQVLTMVAVAQLVFA